MNCYPVVIPTLCRYEYFRRCLLSLERNTLAKKTVVYIILDYPLKEEHWEGYNKIKEFLEKKFDFKKLIIIKREKNFGAYINHESALKDLFKTHNAIIVSEDDNEFSPNFLEYMNTCLEKYENDYSVIAIGGHSLPAKWKTDGNNTIRCKRYCSAWGIGFWKSRENWLSNVNTVQLWNKIKPIKNAIKFFFENPHRRFYELMRFIHKREELKYDSGYSTYMSLFDKYMIYPIISKVRNYGCDGSGQHPIRNTEKEYIDVESRFKIKGNDSVLMRENDIMLRKFFAKKEYGYSKINLLKMIMKYFLIKIGFHKI